MSKTIYSQDYKFVTKQLKKAREEASLTQKEVANKLKKQQSYISKSESGERRLDVIELDKFAKLYKKNINFFIK